MRSNRHLYYTYRTIHARLHHWAVVLFMAAYLPSFAQVQQPEAAQGYLDLSNWNFDQQGSVKLRGQWHFVWQSFADSAQLSQIPQAERAFLATGQIWNQRPYRNIQLPRYGYGTYHLRIRFPQKAGLGLKVNNLASSAKVLFNQKTLTHYGQISDNRAGETPGFYPHVVALPAVAGEVDLIVQVSNFNYFEGGLYQAFELGNYASLIDERQKDFGILFFLVGVILIMAAYHFGLFALRSDDYSSLFFALFALAIGLRAPANGQYYIHEYIDLPWKVMKKLDFGGFYFAVGFLLMFLHQLFPKEFPRRVVYPIFGISLLSGTAVVLLPYRIYGFTLTAFQLFTLTVGAYTTVALVVAGFRGRQGSKSFLFGFLFLFATAINDILHAMNIIFTGHFVSLGLFVFIFSQAFLLSARFSRSYAQSISLSLQLDASNRELEQRVAQRTRSLQEANVELQKLSIVANKTDNGVLILDSTGSIEWANEGFERLTGYRLKELYQRFGTHLHQFLSSLHHPTDWTENVRHEKKSIVFESSIQRPDQQKIWVYTTLSPVVDPQSHALTNMVAVLTDITPQKIAEAEIQQQKVEIEAQRDEVMSQRDYIANQNKRITDSLLYARKIQNAITPSVRPLRQLFADAFLINRPKDIVSGDFFWWHQTEQTIYIAVADCTGHGVPGAFMSSLGISFLNQIISTQPNATPASILELLRQQIIHVLEQEDKHTSGREGIDMALVAIDLGAQQLQYAGAYNPLWIIRQDQILAFRGDRMPVGAFPKGTSPFNNTQIGLQPGDWIYMFTDGYLDQFRHGEPIKFTIGRFKKLLLENHQLEAAAQARVLEEAFDQWKGSHVQIDDVMIVGIRI